MMGNETPLDITLDNDPQQLIFSGRDADEITLTITNNDSRDAASVLVNIVRADLLNKSDLSLSAEELAGAGYQMIDDTWFEVREASPDAWEPIDDWATPYDVGALSASASASFEIRINTPTNATDVGRICFAIMISSKPADALAVTGISIDQTAPAAVVSATTTLTATITGDVGVDDTVLWSSSNEAIATIAATGIATGVAAGKAIISAVAQANTVKRASVFLNIYDNAPVSGMSAWYDFSDAGTITDVADEVTSVTDKSANGYTLTKASAIGPLTEQTTLNSLNVLSFLGNNYLSATGPLGTGSESYTIFGVWGVTDVTSTSQIFLFSGDLSSNGGIRVHADELVGADKIYHDWISAVSQALDISSPGSAHLFQGSYDGTDLTSQITKTGTFDESDSSAETGKNTQNNNLFLGANYLGGFPMTGIIGEVVIYRTILTSAEIAQNRAYLLTKWGL